ncbi:MAG: flagellar basal body-associated FliL family protein [Lachnospiraceae bacterium]|nr:flagellar basal body-associated FliL family protein [Lachnospiraceae bacterium]
MKKNLLSIIILSLLVVNIALTVVMMFSVVKTNQKTAEIVTDIAAILKLELDTGEASQAGEVSIADTQVYTIADQMTIRLKNDDGDEKDHYLIVKVSFSMNTKHDDFATYGALEEKEDLLKGEINSVIGGYTYTEAKLAQDQMCEDILKRVQAMYGSDFIYKVSFSEIIFG